MIQFRLLFIVLLVACFNYSFGQGFLRVDGKNIVDENGENFLLRGMGLGGWMVQEGYMLQTAEFANPQHKIRETIQELVGEESTDQFYEGWLNNHVRKIDIDSLASWGFNSVRLPMHYNLFTLPIEEEPVSGQNTWLEKGFELTDNLISWCKENGMYVVLDLHAAPGGQGYDQGISDYDPTKPSLWESIENRNKTVALWKRIAERYKDEETVAGYDLINEPNWDLPGGTQLRSLYVAITNAIREVDNNHIIFIEGNWFANDFTGLTPPWDDNMVYSPHKYWSINDQGSIQWVLDMRETFNVPLYLGESGENSNVWFRDAIALFEQNNMGWAWWPMKKIESIAGPTSVRKTFGYEAMLNYWKGQGAQPTVESARATLVAMVENLKLENCIYQKDVIDAMFRQVQTDETKPFKANSIPGKIEAVDFVMGRNGYAYFDQDVANYAVSTGNYTAWNTGWSYRNDGVDIERSSDGQSSTGYNVGWLDKGEWMKYTVNVENTGIYYLEIRAAGGDWGGTIRLSDGKADLIPSTFVPFSGGYQDWQTMTIEGIFLEAGKQEIICHVDEAGFNLSSFSFSWSGESNSVNTSFLSAEAREESQILVYLNKPLKESSQVQSGDFSVLINGTSYNPSNVELDEENQKILKVSLNEILRSNDIIRISYSGNNLEAIDDTSLDQFTNEDVENRLPTFISLPAKIEAEDYEFQSGIQLENTSDSGGGQNIGFLDIGDYAEYSVYVGQYGTYQIAFRTAAESQVGEVRLDFIDDFGVTKASKTFDFTSTGGWQEWITTNYEMVIPQGFYTMRMTITRPLFNINWMDFSFLTNTQEQDVDSRIMVFPNPSSGIVYFEVPDFDLSNISYQLMDVSGRTLKKGILNSDEPFINIQDMSEGAYFVRLLGKDGEILIQDKIIKTGR